MIAINRTNKHKTECNMPELVYIKGFGRKIYCPQFRIRELVRNLGYPIQDSWGDDVIFVKTPDYLDGVHYERVYLKSNWIISELPEKVIPTNK